MNHLQSTAVRVVAILFPLVTMTAGLAQQTSTSTTTPKKVSGTLQIDSAQVVYVSGNDVVLKEADGSLRLFDVPAGTSLTVDGKPVQPKDLTPGTSLAHVRVRHAVESEVTTVTQIDGQITHVMAPSWVTLKLNDGTVQRYQIPKNATFQVNGKSATAFELKKGMNLSATAVTTEGLTTHSKAAAYVGATPPPSGTLLILRKRR